MDPHFEDARHHLKRAVESVRKGAEKEAEKARRARS